MAKPMGTYEIGKPVEHRTLSFYVREEAGPAPIPREFAAPPTPTETVDKRAIWIVHGMGQQVPFETLDALAQGVINEASSLPSGWQLLLPPRIVAAKFLSANNPSQPQVVQRVELDFYKPGPPPTRRQLHLYEAYWAPLTEGVAKLSDVLSFLYDGALHGILNCAKPFRRAMFPDDRSPASGSSGKEGKVEDGIWAFRIPKRAALEIVVLLVTVAALGLMNAVIVAATAAKLKFPMFGAWPIAGYWDQLTAIASAATAMTLTFGAVLFLAEMSKRENASALAKGIIVVLSWISLLIATLSIWIAASLLSLIPRIPCLGAFIQHGIHYRATQFVSTAGLLLAALLCAFASGRRAAIRGRGGDHRDGPFPLLLFIGGYALHAAILGLLVAVQCVRFFEPSHLPLWQYRLIRFFGNPFWVWPALLGISKLIRDLIIEYPGDVAIYVAPNKLDRFNEARQKIKQLALDALMPLYSACDSGPADWVYSKVAVIGHSLGSVIAYDTLNKLLILDELLGNQFGVADRTCLLETFGAPLDKTAFFFSYQGKENFNIREQLAASVQPLIQSYARFRKFPWVNIYARSDIICGRLNFYDVNPPESAVPAAANPVSNTRDPDSFVPLVAHVEYWKNHTLWKELLKHVL